MIRLVLALLLCALTLTPTSLDAQPATEIGVSAVAPGSYETFTLANGLEVIVRTDRKAPVVNVSVFYRVGSIDERPDRTGLAHMFEHLMFLGSEHLEGGFARPLQDAGATNLNASTWWDYTEFHQTVPSSALELALFQESDRMGFLPAALRAEAVDRERDVVKNELRQKENAPYGRVEPRILQGVFPPDHPYRWSPLGRLEHLDSVTLEEVRAWYAEHYGPNNAVLVLVGDVDVATARPLVERWFGGLRPGPTRVDLTAFAPALPAARHERMIDNVSATRIFRAWPGPGANDPQSARLDLLTGLLGDGPTSLLAERLVERDAVASNVFMTRQKGAAASMMLLVVDVKAGVEPAAATAALDRALADLRTTGPAGSELDAARARLELRRARGRETSSDRAFETGVAAVQTGDPDRGVRESASIATASPADLHALANQWLSERAYQLDVMPSGSLTATPDADRSHPPRPGSAPPPVFPVAHRSRLANGLQVVVAPRAGEPLTRLALQFDAGLAADPAIHQGLGALVLVTLDEASDTARRLSALGLRIESRVTFDSSSLLLTSTRADGPAAADLLAEAAVAPLPSAATLVRLKDEQVARIGQEASRPDRGYARFVAPRLFPGSPYGASFSGLGSAAAVREIDADDIAAWRQTWLRPDNATLWVVGDLSVDEGVALAQRAFGDWRAPAAAKGVKSTPEPGLVDDQVVLLDRPGAPQTVIVAGLRLPADADPTAVATLNTAFGGAGWSRTNQALRIDRGWAYYALSRLHETRGEDAVLVIAPVQTDKSVESLLELRALLDGYGGDRPIMADELAKVRGIDALAQAGRYESGGAVLDALLLNAELGRPDDWPVGTVGRMETLALDDLQALGRRLYGGAGRVWFIAGDLSRIQADIEALRLGAVTVVDPASGR